MKKRTFSLPSRRSLFATLAASTALLMAPFSAAASPVCEDLFLSTSVMISPVEAHALMTNTDLPLYGQILKQAMAQVHKAMRSASSQPTTADFKNALRVVLEKHGYSEKQIVDRLEMIDHRESKDWRTILGDLSLTDVQTMFYGANLGKPSADSLVGKYIAETGAQTRMIRFDENDRTPKLGPEKLLVAVSEESWPALQRLIFSNPHTMTILGHAATMFAGKFFPNEGGKGGKNPRFDAMRMNELMPMLLMKTSESQRFSRYTWMTAEKRFDGWHDGLKLPWKNEDYCAVGGYTDCTQWVANIPIGDRLVDAYTFPPNYEMPQLGLAPRTAKLQEYKPKEGQEDLVHVWKVPGHEQLADVIGQHQSNIRGEMASPGSLQMVLFARTSTDRVPVVFWITADHRAPIPENPPIFTEPIK